MVSSEQSRPALAKHLPPVSCLDIGNNVTANADGAWQGVFSPLG